MFKVNNKNTRTRCKICSKLTIKTPERRHWRRSGVFIVNFEHISDLALVFLWFTLSRQMPAGVNHNILDKAYIPLFDLESESKVGEPVISRSPKALRKANHKVKAFAGPMSVDKVGGVDS